MSSLKDQWLNSGKVKTSEEWDATYGELPVVIAEDAASLGQALEKLDTVGGYGYLAIWKKNLFLFNTKLLSKRFFKSIYRSNIFGNFRKPIFAW